MEISIDNESNDNGPSNLDGGVSQGKPNQIQVQDEIDITNVDDDDIVSVPSNEVEILGVRSNNTEVREESPKKRRRIMDSDNESNSSSDSKIVSKESHGSPINAANDETSKSSPIVDLNMKTGTLEGSTHSHDNNSNKSSPSPIPPQDNLDSAGEDSKSQHPSNEETLTPRQKQRYKQTGKRSDKAVPSDTHKEGAGTPGNVQPEKKKASAGKLQPEKKSRDLPDRDAKKHVKYKLGQTRAPLSKPRAALKKPPQIRWQDYVANDEVHFSIYKPIGMGAIDLTDFTVGDGDEKQPVVLEDVENLDNEDFEPEQVDLAQGFKVMKKLLQIPLSSLYQEHLERLKKKALQDMSLEKRRKKLETAKVAAILLNVYKVKQLAWIPAVTTQGNKI